MGTFREAKVRTQNLRFCERAPELLKVKGAFAHLLALVLALAFATQKQGQE